MKRKTVWRRHTSIFLLFQTLIFKNNVLIRILIKSFNGLTDVRYLPIQIRTSKYKKLYFQKHWPKLPMQTYLLITSQLREFLLKSIWTNLSFELSFKLWWCRTQNFLWITNVCKEFPLQTLLWSLNVVIHKKLWARHHAAYI